MDNDEYGYLRTVQAGGTHERLQAARQLQDELDTIRASAKRLRKVFEILEDDEGIVAAQHIGSYASIAEDRQRHQVREHVARLAVKT
jgi:hypothetical protein